MNKLNKLRIIIVLALLIGYAGLTYFYGWPLPLFLFLVFFGHELNKQVREYEGKE